jgi:hypothetical protein
MLLGAILSIVLAITSKHPIPIAREIRAHILIAIAWPFVLLNIGRIFSKTIKGENDNKEED